MELPVFKRDITSIIAKRLCEEKHFIQVITGPRQVGKTTAIHQVLRNTVGSFGVELKKFLETPIIEWLS